MAQTTLATPEPTPAVLPTAAARRGGGPRASLARTLVEAGYVVLFAILLVRLIMLLRTPLPPPDLGEGATVHTGPSVPLAVLTARDPFGGELGDAPEPLAYADASETTLDLVLRGLNIGSDLTTAIIQTPDGRQGTYVTGGEIIPGVVFRDARPNQAILSRDGLTETLTLRDEQDGAAQARPQRRPASRDLPPSAAMLTPAQALAAVAGTIDIRRAENGALALFPGAGGAAFSGAGFAPGDVVVAVNGTPAPDDAERVLELIADMPPGRPVTITVERGGIPLDVPLDLGALTR